MSMDQKSPICRVCMNYVKDTCLSLFEKYNNCLISELINELTNISIKEGDGFPDRICPTCYLQLQSAYKFKKTCENTNEILLLANKHFVRPCKSPVETLPVKKECFDDDVDNVGESFLSDLQDDDIEVTPKVEPQTKTSKAIDLKLQCHDCGGFFKSKCKLLAHWKKVHVKCFSCLKTFKTFAALKYHKEKNLKSCVTASKYRIEGEGKARIFYCKQCNFKSSITTRLRLHALLHSENKPFQCHICQKCYTFKHNLTAHIESVHKMYSFEGACEFCGKYIKGKVKMKTHLRKHRKNEKFECKICNNMLASKDGLKAHMKRHSGVKLYLCEICSKSFFTGSELSCHRTKHHLKSKNYICEICGYKTIWYTSMDKHKKKHSGLKVPCNICGTFLDTELQLSLHKLRHTDKNYQCPHCDKKFFSRRLVSVHVRKIHKVSKTN